MKRAQFDFKDVPDFNFLTLLKAIRECPKTERELRLKTERQQREKDRQN